MKEKWELYALTLDEKKTVSKKDLLLLGLVSVLGGIVVGMLLSPRKTFMIGSNNGNQNGSYNQDNNKNNSGSVTAESCEDKLEKTKRVLNKEKKEKEK